MYILFLRKPRQKYRKKRGHRSPWIGDMRAFQRPGHGNSSVQPDCFLGSSLAMKEEGKKKKRKRNSVRFQVAASQVLLQMLKLHPGPQSWDCSGGQDQRVHCGIVGEEKKQNPGTWDKRHFYMCCCIDALMRPILINTFFLEQNLEKTLSSSCPQRATANAKTYCLPRAPTSAVRWIKRGGLCQSDSKLPALRIMWCPTRRGITVLAMHRRAALIGKLYFKAFQR